MGDTDDHERIGAGGPAIAATGAAVAGAAPAVIRPAAWAAMLVCAFGIAICAAAPEFIWQGLGIFFGHATWTNLVSALLIAVVFVAFIEPILDRARGVLLEGRDIAADPPSRGPLFTAGLGLTFGLLSVCLHEAIAAFVSGHGDPHHPGLRQAIEVAVTWAVVPFFVAVAWQAAGDRLLRVPTGIVAALAPGLAGWAFGWPLHVIVTTAVPTLIILLAGYHQMRATPGRVAFARHAAMVAVVAAAWLGLAAIADWSMAAFNLGAVRIYDAPDLFADFRFYVGWALGLLLAKAPRAA